MRVADIQGGKATLLEVVPLGAEAFGTIEPLSEVSLVLGENGAPPLVRIGESVWPVAGAKQSDEETLSDLLGRALPRVGWVATGRGRRDGAASNSLVIETREFPAAHGWPDRIEIGVDDRVVESVSKNSGKQLTIQAVIELLQNGLVVESDADGPLVLLSAGTGPSAERNSAFRLHGREWLVDVKRDDADKLIVDRIVFSRSRIPESDVRPILLISGAFSFVDQTVAGQFRGTARSELDQIVNTAGSYLGIWREYNRLERSSIVRRAKEFGWHRYTSCEQQADGVWRFWLVPNPRLEAFVSSLEEDEAVGLEASAAPPPELLLDEGELSEGELEGSESTASFSGDYIGFNRDRTTLDLRPPTRRSETLEPASSGVIHLGLTGDRVRLRRRLDAQRAITQATTAMPQLGLLIEGKPVPVRRRRGVKPLSAAAKEAFNGEPTDRQAEAVRIALNTPDIALIQGPPGTGKTRTIAAINTRLAEMAEESNRVAARFLLSSYQHDAVENVANVTQAFGLPAVKVGKRKDQVDGVDGVARWREDLIESVRSRLATIETTPASSALSLCRDLSISYLRAPHAPKELSRLLSEVHSAAAPHVGSELTDQLVELQQRFRYPDTTDSGMLIDQNRLLSAVHGLRTDVLSFGDDGVTQSIKALKRLDGLGALNPAERTVLTKATEWETGQPLDFLADLELVKGVLIERFSATETQAAKPQVNEDVSILLGKIVSELQSVVNSSSLGVDSALDMYLNDMVNDGAGARAAVERYTAVVAATCQQAVGYHMGQLKEDDSAFDTVIVDEAARANPLDLLIPMARAERRVILVGDHRQLPHVLDNEIESELDSEVSEKTREMLQKSLFQRLFLQLRDLEKQDGIKRTATLNRQYRMHPVLGDFVSATFYEPYGEGFESGLPADSFRHHLVRYGDAVAAWVDIPASRGLERRGKSKSRAEEARWIADEVHSVMNERPDLSVGVISFYAAQVFEIQREFEKFGITEMTDNGAFRIAPAWRATSGQDGKLVERLRIGTVDSFQGKEFDVVFLSMTRSNNLGIDSPKELRRKFGHLLLENRLCVAMSRQKRLLVLVGDSGMIRTGSAADAVPGLAQFLELCRGEHGTYFSA